MRNVAGCRSSVVGLDALSDPSSPATGVRPPAAAWGFTLLEIVLVIMLAAAISVVLGLVVSQGVRGGLAQAERRDMVKEGTEALEKMTRDIRMISDSDAALPGGCVANAANLDVECASGSQFEFRSNASADRVCYERDVSQTLWRRSGTCGGGCCSGCDQNEPLARNVVNASPFTYYRYNGATTATLCDIWRIQIELQLRRGTSTTDPMRNVTLRTSVFPRDLAER